MSLKRGSKIGILGGGQLALMMLPAIKRLGFQSVVLDHSSSPCSDLADQFIEGDFSSLNDCLKLSDCDVVSYEIENISLEGYRELGLKVPVYPAPSVLETIKNKGRQKTFLLKNKIPTSAFEIVKLSDSIDWNGKVVKLTTGGYDGRGVWVSSDQDPPEGFIGQECVVEDRVQIKKELAQVISRGRSGQIELYDLVEMKMNEELNLLEYQHSPAVVTSEVSRHCQELARKIAENLNYIGTLAVELFLDENDRLWVNELAPRVHNSGHNTIESAGTSQFENHIRAICGLELGPTKPSQPSMTINILGQGEEGETVVQNDLNGEDTYVHLYRKKISRPGRKMGHVTILGEIGDKQKAFYDIRDKIKIEGQVR